MTTYQQSPYINSPNYEHDFPVQNLKKTSKSVSKYIQTSSMLYSPNIDNLEKLKNTHSNSVLVNQVHMAELENNTNKQDNRSLNLTNIQEQKGLGKIIFRLENRIQGAEVKIASLTNIVKLLQKYSQTKDDQYQKQKQNILFNKSLTERVQQIQRLDLGSKVKQFDFMSKQFKKQIQQISEIKHKFEKMPLKNHEVHNNIEKEQQNKKYTSNKSKLSDLKSPTSQGSMIDVEDINMVFEQMQKRLRQEINRKIEICMKQIMKINVNQSTSQVSGIDQHLFQEQINSLNFAMNKIENESLRNKMVLEKKIQEIVSLLPTSSAIHNIPNNSDYFPRKLQNLSEDQTGNFQKAVRDKSHGRKKSDHSTISRQKSRSHLKNNTILQKKKQKQQLLKQAIRRKKQTKQKIKAKNF